MDVNTYLTNLSKLLVLSSADREKIDASIVYLKKSLWGYFQDTLDSTVVFGSYDRGTMLSPSTDNEADIDMLIIFKKGIYQPQTYLSQLQKFAEKNYSRSEIFRDFPTVVIQLQHIRFELVPAYIESGFFSDDLKIPASTSKEVQWLTTEPMQFKDDLNKKNSEEHSFIIPLVLIMKYWNKLQGKPYGSYELEKFILARNYPCSIFKEYFYEIINDMNEQNLNESAKFATKKLFEKSARMLSMEKGNLSEYYEQELMSFLPYP